MQTIALILNRLYQLEFPEKDCINNLPNLVCNKLNIEDEKILSVCGGISFQIEQNENKNLNIHINMPAVVTQIQRDWLLKFINECNNDCVSFMLNYFNPLSMTEVPECASSVISNQQPINMENLRKLLSLMFNYGCVITPRSDRSENERQSNLLVYTRVRVIRFKQLPIDVCVSNCPKR